jgi:hypothetical protein
LENNDEQTERKALMACKVKVSRHGKLAFRFYWNGREFWQGTDWKDTAKNRIKAEGKAVEITEQIKAGTFDYLKWFPNGNKADDFRPKSDAQAAERSLTVAEYYRDWIERRKPPFVRPGLHHDYVRQFRRYILPNFESKRLVDVDLMALDVFRASLNQVGGLSLKSCRNIIDGTFRAMMRDAEPWIDRPLRQPEMEEAPHVEARPVHAGRARRYLEALSPEARFLLSLRRHPVRNRRQAKRDHRASVGRHRLEARHAVY